MVGLRELRKGKGMTLKALSEKSGVHQVRIAQYEAGKFKVENMSLRNALKLSEALDCHPRDLLASSQFDDSTPTI
jgi:transcriptional regulator with XRE-family HTH domain